MENLPGEVDGHEVEGLEIRTPEARKFAGLVSICDDLGFVVRCAERILREMAGEEMHEESRLLVRALWASSLVAYKRCFSDGKRAFLGEDDVKSLPLKGDVLEWHRFLVQMRNKHIAHSVNPFEEVRVAVFPMVETGDIGVGPLLVKHFVADERGVTQLGELATALLSVIQRRIDEQWNALVEVAKRMTPEQLAQLKPLEQVVPGPEAAGKARD